VELEEAEEVLEVKDDLRQDISKAAAKENPLQWLKLPPISGLQGCPLVESEPCMLRQMAV
jgi:hypothetical protein